MIDRQARAFLDALVGCPPRWCHLLNELVVLWR
jgi:hypothetical protein